MHRSVEVVVSRSAAEQIRQRGGKFMMTVLESFASGGAWLRVGMAKDFLGVSRARVYQLIESGGLQSVKKRGRVLVEAQSVLDRVKGEKRS